MKTEKKYIVYKHTCPNKKVYIGVTCRNPSYRWNNGKGYIGQMFYNAILKYGWDNIKHEILFDSLTKEEAEAKEVELIAAYKSNQREHGYNISSGGENIHNGAFKYRDKIVCESFRVIDREGNKVMLECLNCGRKFWRSYGSITSTKSKVKCLCMRKYTPHKDKPPRQWHLISYNGETHNAGEWARILGINRQTIIFRDSKGYDIVKGKNK